MFDPFLVYYYLITLKLIYQAIFKILLEKQEGFLIY